MAWRGIIHQPLKDWSNGLALQYWGQGQRFGLLSMGQGKMYWFASLNSQSPDADQTLLEKKEFLTQRFEKWHPRVKEALSLTAESDILVRPIEAGTKLQSWHHRRVALMGDAAHAITPNLGQGACMAIEDAAVLASQLKTTDSVAAALTTYERKRMPRVHQVRMRSYLLGRLGQLENGALVRMRSLGLGLAPDGFTRLSFQSLFKGI
jgi:2-polyprenyl-6-methoxyphenol hydroxylase-like FAD-dependent oxidoreductase